MEALPPSPDALSLLLLLFTVSCTLPDGACFFRAVSLRLFGTEGGHLYVRMKVCNWLEENEAMFRDSFSSCEDGRELGDWSAYVARMRLPTTFAGAFEIVAVTWIFCYRVAVINLVREGSVDSAAVLGRMGDVYDRDGLLTDPLLFVYLHEGEKPQRTGPQHYSLLTPREGAEELSAAPRLEVAPSAACDAPPASDARDVSSAHDAPTAPSSPSASASAEANGSDIPPASPRPTASVPESTTGEGEEEGEEGEEEVAEAAAAVGVRACLRVAPLIVIIINVLLATVVLFSVALVREHASTVQAGTGPHTPTHPPLSAAGVLLHVVRRHGPRHGHGVAPP